jgi:segregation and condensation protein B
LLDLSLPVGFEVPDPSRSGPDEEEDPIEDGDAPEFAQDFVGD